MPVSSMVTPKEAQAGFLEKINHRRRLKEIPHSIDLHQSRLDGTPKVGRAEDGWHDGRHTLHSDRRSRSRGYDPQFPVSRSNGQVEVRPVVAPPV